MISDCSQASPAVIATMELVSALIFGVLGWNCTSPAVTSRSDAPITAFPAMVAMQTVIQASPPGGFSYRESLGHSHGKMSPPGWASTAGSDLEMANHLRHTGAGRYPAPLLAWAPPPSTSPAASLRTCFAGVTILSKRSKLLGFLGQTSHLRKQPSRANEHLDSLRGQEAHRKDQQHVGCDRDCLRSGA